MLPVITSTIDPSISGVGNIAPIIASAICAKMKAANPNSAPFR